MMDASNLAADRDFYRPTLPVARRRKQIVKWFGEWDSPDARDAVNGLARAPTCARTYKTTQGERARLPHASKRHVRSYNEYDSKQKPTNL